MANKYENRSTEITDSAIFYKELFQIISRCKFVKNINNSCVSGKQ